MRGTMAAGRFYETGNIARHDQVAVLDDQAARTFAAQAADGAWAVPGILGASQKLFGAVSRTAAPPRRPL
ncbi:hypothetical protein [Streptomyces sp. NPDC050422]|uniref:hypothetical protein n=1 Tax=Streptomyces sp. NPDC050422 TaxID=3365614 RepID=UPI00379F9ECA